MGIGLGPRWWRREMLSWVTTAAAGSSSSSALLASNIQRAGVACSIRSPEACACAAATCAGVVIAARPAGALLAAGLVDHRRPGLPASPKCGRMKRNGFDAPTGLRNRRRRRLDATYGRCVTPAGVGARAGLQPLLGGSTGAWRHAVRFLAGPRHA